MTTPTQRLEEVLTEAGVSPEAAQPLIEEIQRVARESVALQADAGASEPEPSEGAVSLEGQMLRMEQKIDRSQARMEQKLDDLQAWTEHLQARMEHLHAMTEQKIAMTEQKVDGLHELMEVQFTHVDHRFKAIDDRLDRERRERWGFVTAAAGAITAGLLRVFGAI